MKIIVQKFGGTSVGDIDKIRNIAKLIKKEINRGNKVVVVVSAMAGVTNTLISKCNEVSGLIETEALREYDAAIASGEVVSSALLSLALQNENFKAKSLQGWQIPIKTNKNSANAEVEEVGAKLISGMLENDIIPVITGFQGINEYGDITTLGKGGSDTSAALIAAAISADRCDIYTDVDGIFSADPRIVHDAHKIDKISTRMLVAMCSSGAKILHPRAALASYYHGFDMRILSSFNEELGTEIIRIEESMEKRVISAIVSNKNLIEIDISKYDEDISFIFDQFREYNIKIHHFSNNSGAIQIIADLSDKAIIENILKKNEKKCIWGISAEISSVSIVGYGISNNGDFCWKIMSYLNENGIKISSVNYSEVKIMYMLNDKDTEKAIKLLHGFCFGDNK